MNFANWNVMVDIGFWSRLSKKKIEQYKLQSTDQPLHAKYKLTSMPDKRPILSIDAYSFGDTIEQIKQGPVQYTLKGTFLNTNTDKDFLETDFEAEEKKLIQKQNETIDKLIKGETVEQIQQIRMLIYGDFKKYLFKYRFIASANSVKDYKVINYLSVEKQLVALLNEIYKGYVNKQTTPPPFMVLNSLKVSSVEEFIAAESSQNFLFCVTDFINYPKTTGFHISTILTLFAKLLAQKKVSKEKLSRIRLLLVKQFFVYNLQTDYSFKNSQIVELDLSTICIDSFQNRIQHKKGVLDLDLKSFMDDKSLAKSAVDLNIKLMKWRLLPSLNIQKIHSKKCLLFGAGTLGCQLARNLIGWGIKNISFIDYSNVSYSNPVRQSLYTFEDTIGGGKPKAKVAAQKLKAIYPEINSQGYHIQVPMPGHYVSKQEHIKQTFENLNLIQKLVQEHDAIFLLLDSREARWLPTVLANKYDKACITVGLGFDSFVVVRHGVPPQLHDQKKHGERISCYFCNDIITPQNTMKDRTLDQMCTVTRPGLSFSASAYASQLYISLIHHQLEHHAPAHQDPQKLQETELGKLPHHLRGNMSDFETDIFYGRVFDNCVACSKFILDQYLKNRQQFMLKVLNDPSFIHEVVQLKDQLEMMEEIDGNIIEINDEDFFDMDNKEEQTKQESKETKQEAK